MSILPARHRGPVPRTRCPNSGSFHETLRDLPSVPTTPIGHHLADKICALYERHGQDGDEASTRYRDLADIVRIVAAIPFDAARLTTVLEREAGRRQMTLPNKVQAPSEDWVVGFPRSAAGFAEYPQEYWDLNAALTFCSTCLDEILNGQRTSGTWDPDRRSWQSDYAAAALTAHAPACATD